MIEPITLSDMRECLMLSVREQNMTDIKKYHHAIIVHQQKHPEDLDNGIQIVKHAFLEAVRLNAMGILEYFHNALQQEQEVPPGALLYALFYKSDDAIIEKLAYLLEHCSRSDLFEVIKRSVKDDKGFLVKNEYLEQMPDEQQKDIVLDMALYNKRHMIDKINRHIIQDNLSNMIDVAVNAHHHSLVGYLLSFQQTPEQTVQGLIAAAEDENEDMIDLLLPCTNNDLALTALKNRQSVSFARSSEYHHLVQKIEMWVTADKENKILMDNVPEIANNAFKKKI